MAATVKAKGELIDNPSDNNIGSSQFVRCTATGGAQSVIVKNSDGLTLGHIYLHAIGDNVIVEKIPTDTITLADVKVSAVISCFGQQR